MKVRALKPWHVRQTRNLNRHFRRYKDLPAQQRTGLVTGEIGTLFGMTVITDSIKSPAPIRLPLEPRDHYADAAEDRYIAMLDHRHERGGGR